MSLCSHSSIVTLKNAPDVEECFTCGAMRQVGAPWGSSHWDRHGQHLSSADRRKLAFDFISKRLFRMRVAEQVQKFQRLAEQQEARAALYAEFDSPTRPEVMQAISKAWLHLRCPGAFLGAYGNTLRPAERGMIRREASL